MCKTKTVHMPDYADGADHSEFQSHFLRAWAPKLPWYVRPTLQDTPHTVDDFVQHTYDRLRSAEVILPEYRRLVTKQMLYMLLNGLSKVHVQTMSLEEVVDWYRKQLAIYSSKKEMRDVGEHSPMNRDFKAKPVSGMSLTKRLELTTGDARSLKQFSTSPQLDHLPEIIPELSITQHPRLIVYMSAVRQQIRTKLEQESLTDDVRQELFDVVVDEWINMSRHRQSTGELDELIRECGMPAGLLDMDMQDVVRQATPVLRIMNKEEEQRMAPLLEEIGMRLLMEPTMRDKADELAVMWSQFLVKHNIPSCDRPSLTAILLANMLTDNNVDRDNILDRL